MARRAAAALRRPHHLCCQGVQAGGDAGRERARVGPADGAGEGGRLLLGLDAPAVGPPLGGAGPAVGLKGEVGRGVEERARGRGLGRQGEGDVLIFVPLSLSPSQNSQVQAVVACQLQQALGRVARGGGRCGAPALTPTTSPQPHHQRVEA